MAEIKGKIVRILSDREVVIDKGSANGVKYSMEFVIYEEADPVVDPKSREILARIDLVKNRVYVTHIQERICIAETAPSGLGTGSAVAQGGPVLSQERDGKSLQPKLDVDPGDIMPPRDVSHRVRVGDKVRSVER